MALHACLYRRSTTLARLRWALPADARGVAGVAVLKKLISYYESCPKPAQSPLEVKVMRAFRAVASALPPPVRQHPVHIGGATYFLDFAFPHARVAIEADGHVWHSSRPQWRRDKRRISALAAAGWRFVFVTDEDARDPNAPWMAHVRELLAAPLF